MAQVINTNVASLNAQNNLNQSKSALNTSLERLSTGLRINSAKDDAAGLAIAQRFTTQIRGIDQATRNANDGISLAQTAEGALGEVGNNLQRIRELGVQAANATNSASDRAALQSEVQQRIAEITRTSNQTQFNGSNLLNGSFTNAQFQVGANAGQTITVDSIVDSRASALGNNLLTADGSVTGDVVTGSGSDNGVTAVASGGNFTLTSTDAGGNTQSTGAITYAANSGANVISDAVGAAGSGVGVSATASNATTLSNLTGTGDGDGTVSFTLETQTSNGDGTFSAVSENISAVVDDQNDLSSIVSAVNGVTSSTGITAEFTDGDKSSIELTTNDGRNIGVSAFAVNDGGTGSNESVDLGGTTLTEGGTVAAVKTGTVELQSSSGSISTQNANTEVFASASANSSFSSLAAVDISTAAGASTGLAVVDAALSQVNSARADLGAIQNRFDSTISNLSSTSENLSAARSRIQDADFASETAKLTKAQILQQAGTSVLSQANQVPQNVLSLLQ